MSVSNVYVKSYYIITTVYDTMCSMCLTFIFLGKWGLKTFFDVYYILKYNKPTKNQPNTTKNLYLYLQFLEI